MNHLHLPAMPSPVGFFPQSACWKQIECNTVCCQDLRQNQFQAIFLQTCRLYQLSFFLHEYSWARKPQFREAGYRHSCFVVPHCISSPYTSATEGSAWSRSRSRPCRHAMRSSLYLICDQGIITKQMYASYRYHSTGINGTTFLEWWCNKHRILQIRRTAKKYCKWRFLYYIPKGILFMIATFTHILHFQLP